MRHRRKTSRRSRTRFGAALRVRGSCSLITSNECCCNDGLLSGADEAALAELLELGAPLLVLDRGAQSRPRFQAFRPGRLDERVVVEVVIGGELRCPFEEVVELADPILLRTYVGR